MVVGEYVTIAQTAVRQTHSMRSKKIRTDPVGTRLRVVEVRFLPENDRLRGRLAKGGWCSMMVPSTGSKPWLKKMTAAEVAAEAAAKKKKDEEAKQKEAERKAKLERERAAKAWTPCALDGCRPLHTATADLVACVHTSPPLDAQRVVLPIARKHLPPPYNATGCLAFPSDASPFLSLGRLRRRRGAKSGN